VGLQQQVQGGQVPTPPFAMDAAASLNNRQKKPSDASATSDGTLGRQLSTWDVLNADDVHGHGHSPSGKSNGWGLLLLSFSALGIIYGDIGESAGA